MPLPASASDLTNLDIQELETALQTGPDGLDEADAKIRLKKLGLNDLGNDREQPWPLQLVRAFNTPFNYLLMALAGVGMASGDLAVVVIISSMVLISGGLRFMQEYQSGRAAARLKSMVHTTATVVRPGMPHAEIAISQLVPGDVVLLAAGDLVPADVRFLLAKDLQINQASLTGESMPIEKGPLTGTEAKALLASGSAPLDLPCLGYMGSTVISGSGRALVLHTGKSTYMGSIAGGIAARRGSTAFDRGVNASSMLLVRFMFVMVPIIFVINGVTKGDWFQALLFGVSVAVGLTPEMLPMIVTANLARGAVAMSRSKVIVKYLPAIQNLGGMDVLCTDKTGTLTQDKVVLIKHLAIDGTESEEVLKHTFLNSFFQTGLKSLLDRAVLEHEEKQVMTEMAGGYEKEDEIPFDFQRRRMSVVVRDRQTGKDLLICKGAAEEVLECCDTVLVGDTEQPLTDSIREQINILKRDMNEDGLRVIALALKPEIHHKGRPYTVADEADLTLAGLVAFLDPPKESAGPALAALDRLGVRVKILTGDNDLLARKVCRDVGIKDPVIMLGGQVEAFGDVALEDAAEKTTLFAKMSPAQKARVVAALKRRGHTVGFLGDGVNDAPALREADVGISVDTAVDIARESADIILLEKSLMVLKEGVLLGRETFGNTVKYIKMAASSNFGNMLSVLVASVWLPFLPMLPIHLLVQNLLYDISQVGIPFDRTDDDFLAQPRPWRIADLGRFMLVVGPVSSLFDILTFCILIYVFMPGFDGNHESLFQSAWFVEGLLSQTLIIHMIRTARRPFIDSMASTGLTALTLGVMAAGLMVPGSALGEWIGMTPLPLSYYPFLLAILAGYIVCIQLVKTWYIRRFGCWL